MKTHSEVSGLFRLALSDFTTARNVLVTKLRRAGRNAEAERVRSLPKPSIPAWVVNQLYWRHATAFGRLIASGDRFRAAQASTLSGKPQDIRGPFEARRKALLHLTRLATNILSRAGHRTTPDLMRRVTKTLEALSTYGSLPDAPPAGHLTDDVDPPGFETLAALVPRAGRAERGNESSQVIPFRHAPGHRATRRTSPEEQERLLAEQRKAALASARKKATESARALGVAKKTARKAEAALKAVAARAKIAERDRIEAEARFTQAASTATAAHQEAHRIASEAEEAAQAIEDAERALDEAKREITNLVELGAGG